MNAKSFLTFLSKNVGTLITIIFATVFFVTFLIYQFLLGKIPSSLGYIYWFSMGLFVGCYLTLKAYQYLNRIEKTEKEDHDKDRNEIGKEDEN